MRLPARLLSLRGSRGLTLKGLRGLGRGPLAVVVVLAGAALAMGMAKGSSHRAEKGSPHRAEKGSSQHAVRTAEPRPVVVAPTAVKRVAAKELRRPHRGGPEHYRRTTRKRVPAAEAEEFLPLYREAERVYGVSWRLLASIHRQETAFSHSKSTYHGLNDYGCCAGPMQFNVTNGPVSTWERYRDAYRQGRRPERYPHRTRRHPSIYDDFDAIMAAGSLLKASGAGGALDGAAWSAAFAYYGHDLFGITYASTVVARAEAWRRNGFCPNCEPPTDLVDEFDGAYGAPVRSRMLADERRKEAERKRKGRKRRDAERKRRRRAAQDRAKRREEAQRRRAREPSARRDRPTRPSRPGPRPRRRKPPERKSPPPPATPDKPSATSPTTPPAPAECPPIRRLLGCRP